MSEGLAERLSDIRRRREELERQRRAAGEALAAAVELGRVIDLTARTTGIAEIDAKLAAVRSEEETVLLDLISKDAGRTNEILGAVRDATRALNASSAEQLAATRQLEASSNRLNIVTDALLLLTAVLAPAAVGSYALPMLIADGLAPKTAANGALAIVLITLGLVAPCLFWIARRRRRPIALPAPAAPVPVPPTAPAVRGQNPPGADDRRTKTLEFVGTLGGLLGVIVTLLVESLPTPVRVLFTTVVILFIIFAFLAYASVSIGWERERTNAFLRMFCATFSGLIAMSFAVTFTLALVEVASDFDKALGFVGTVVAFIVLVGAFSIAIYYGFARTMVFAFEQMTPPVAAQPAPAPAQPPQRA